MPLWCARIWRSVWVVALQSLTNLALMTCAIRQKQLICLPKWVSHNKKCYILLLCIVQHCVCFLCIHVGCHLLYALVTCLLRHEAPSQLRQATVVCLPFPQTLYQQPSLVCHRIPPTRAKLHDSLECCLTDNDLCVPAFLSVQATTKCMLPNILSGIF